MSTQSSGAFSSSEDLARFKADLLDAVGQAVVATDLEGRVLFWNRVAEDLYGRDRSQALGRTKDELHTWEADPERTREIRQAVARGETWAGEVQGRRRDGSTFPVLVTASPIRDRDGAVAGMVEVSADLTGRKHLERRLLAAQRLEAVGQLAGGVAHDFNNVLTAMKGYIDLLRHRVKDDREALQDLLALIQLTQRAQDLTRQLLAFSRRQIIAPRLVQPDEVLARFVGVLEALAGDIITVELRAGGVRPVRVDPGQLEEVVVHLVLNAREAMPRGGRLLLETSESTVGPDESPPVAEMPPGEYMVLAVGDEGVGIPEPLRDRVFEPFFTTRPGATGLGLSTVYGIVKQSEGFIGLESEEGGGSTFRIYLPVAEESTGESAAGPTDGEAGEDPAAGASGSRPPAG